MKIIHCADLHLDSKMTSNLDYEKAKERKNELLHTYGDMVDYGAKNGVRAIIIAGDMFDDRDISGFAVNAVFSSIENHPEMDFYYLKGNHDGDGFIDRLEYVPNNLKVFGNDWTSYKTGKNIIITGATRPDAYLELPEDAINIVTLHGQDGVDFSLRNLRNKNIDYLALGHIHMFSHEKLDERGQWCYSGCLEGRGFDECGEHGFVLVDIDEDRHSVDFELIPIAHRNLYQISVDVSGCGNTYEVSEKIREKLDENYYDSKDLLKICLTGDSTVMENVSTDILEKEYDNQFYFIKVVDETNEKIDYSRLNMDESLKGEFIRLVMSDESLSEDEKKRIIRYGVQALSGEDID